MFVEALMPVARGRLTTIGLDGSLTDAAKLLSERNIGLVVVCAADGSVAGVVTKTDIVRQVARDEPSIHTAPVSAIMTTPLIHCRQSDRLFDVWSSMNDRGFAHIPVVDEQLKSIAVVNAWDALRALLGQVSDEKALLSRFGLSPWRSSFRFAHDMML